MKNERNTNGQFAKGHGGFKPKGAISKKKRQRTARLDHILQVLEESIKENFHLLTPKEVMRTYLEICRLTIPKPARIPHVPEPPSDPVPNATFKVVQSGKKNSGTPGNAR